MTEVSGVAQEIERKFLLKSLPDKAFESNHFHVYHGWIPGEVIQERITWNSRDGGEFWRAIKFGKGIERTEAQERIYDMTLWNDLYSLTTKRISKTRYIVEEGSLKWEVDHFNDDLVIAEVEIPTVDTVVEFPAWLKSEIIREVTDEPEYLNINLAHKV